MFALFITLTGCLVIPVSDLIANMNC